MAPWDRRWSIQNRLRDCLLIGNDGGNYHTPLCKLKAQPRRARLGLRGLGASLGAANLDSGRSRPKSSPVHELLPRSEYWPVMPPEQTPERVRDRILEFRRMVG